MRSILARLAVGLAAAICIAAPAAAQVLLPQVRNAAGAYVPSQGAVCLNPDGSACAAGMPAAASTPLSGTSTGAQTVGPFTPQLGRPIVVALSGTWSGTVQLMRSTDAGTTKLPLTPAGVTLGAYTAQGVDTPWVETEAGATFYLVLPATGIAYRVSQ